MFRFREKEKSHGLKSGELGGWGTTEMRFEVKNFVCPSVQLWGFSAPFWHKSFACPNRLSKFDVRWKCLNLTVHSSSLLLNDGLISQEPSHVQRFRQFLKLKLSLSEVDLRRVLGLPKIICTGGQLVLLISDVPHSPASTFQKSHSRSHQV